MNYCKKCGQELQPDWILCPKCTKLIKTNHERKKSYRGKSEYPYRNKGLCVLILGLIFTCFSFVQFSYYYYWVSYYLTNYGNSGMYAPGLIFSIILIGISILVIIGGISLFCKKRNY